MEVKYRKDGIEFIDLQGNKTFLNIDDIIKITGLSESEILE